MLCRCYFKVWWIREPESRLIQFDNKKQRNIFLYLRTKRVFNEYFITCFLSSTLRFLPSTNTYYMKNSIWNWDKLNFQTNETKLFTSDRMKEFPFTKYTLKVYYTPLIFLHQLQWLGLPLLHVYNTASNYSDSVRNTKQARLLSRASFPLFFLQLFQQKSTLDSYF